MNQLFASNPEPQTYATVRHRTENFMASDICSKIGEETGAYLETIGLPKSDLNSIPTSEKRFASGSHFGIEIASAQTPSIMKEMIDLIRARNLPVTRFTETRGIFRLSDASIREMAELSRRERVGLCLSVGPRAYYDTSASAHTPQGSRIAYRLRGMNNVVYAIEDIKRAASLGVRGILIYDEGLLWLVNRMRQDGKLPSDMLFKVSVHCGHGNPVSLKLLEENGANSVNVVGDLSLGMVSACRAAVNIPIDVHSDTPTSSGGFIRTYEVPELIRVGAPLHLKSGAVTSPTHAHLPSSSQIEERIEQACRVWEMTQRHAPWAEVTKEVDKWIPVPID